MQWSIVAIMLSLLWSMIGIVIALWPPTTHSYPLTLDSMIDQIRMVIMLGTSIGLVGFTNLTETMIWIWVILFFAIIVAYCIQSERFVRGFLIGLGGGGIAAFIQLFLLTINSERLRERGSWLADVPFDFSELSNQLSVLPFTAITRGLLLGTAVTCVAFVMSSLRKPAPPSSVTPAPPSPTPPSPVIPAPVTPAPATPIAAP